jgi:hypothetical protein
LRLVIYYSVVSTIIALTGFVTLNATLPSDVAPNQSGLLLSPFLGTMGLMFCAGALGGCLYNFRGLIKHSQNADFHDRYALTYYSSPSVRRGQRTHGLFPPPRGRAHPQRRRPH